MGKGSTRRPAQIPQDQYASNYDRTFGKGKHPEPTLGTLFDPADHVAWINTVVDVPGATNDISPDE